MAIQAGKVDYSGAAGVSTAQQRCECGHQIVRDGVIRSRAVKLDDGTAKCRCKRWVVIEALRRAPAA